VLRLLLVDNHNMVRESLGYVLNLQPDFTVIGGAGSLADARPLLAGADVVLVDLFLPDGPGTDLIPDLRRANSAGLALVLTGSTDLVDSARALEQGARGVLSKAAPVSEICAAIRRARAGQPLHTLEELASFRAAAQERDQVNANRARLLGELTRRERDLLQALAEGLSDQEIAERFSISPRTVQSHLLRLYDKFGTTSRMQTLIAALRYGIVEISPQVTI
jgi:DNA-binding NarL/FixJ family response regulator